MFRHCGDEMTRPTPEELAAAREHTVPDVLTRDLDLLLVGINPSLYSAHTGQHFARPGNRFWPALHQAGFTPYQLSPAEQNSLPKWGLGITNLVARATARADELTPDELVAGGRRLVELVDAYRPRCLGVLGLGAYRTAFAARRAVVGLQPHCLADTALWVLPNPSGLNAHWPLQRIVAELQRLRAWSQHGSGNRNSPQDV